VALEVRHRAQCHGGRDTDCVATFCKRTQRPKISEEKKQKETRKKQKSPLIHFGMDMHAYTKIVHSCFFLSVFLFEIWGMSISAAARATLA